MFLSYSNHIQLQEQQLSVVKSPAMIFRPVNVYFVTTNNVLPNSVL
ncbi:hypothetical protein PP707_05775 [Acetobacter pasteurianus]|nr:hypothetical protein [Acetobacter pasteurianus]